MYGSNYQQDGDYRMKKKGILFAMVAIVWALPGTALFAATLDCTNGIISAGDSRVDLLMKCGEPSSKESHQEEIVDFTSPGVRHKTYVTVDEWTYDFGPSKFTRIVTLKNGQVFRIGTGGYGYSGNTKTPARECTEQSLSTGERTSDVIAKCGEPTWKDTRQEEKSARLETGLVQKTLVTIEEWTYNLGPNRFVRILTFRNGKLTDIRIGGYGYELRQEEKKKTP